MEPNRYIASKIGLARGISGMSIATLARRAGMTSNALSESLRGNRTLTTAELVELALVLEIDLVCFVEKERYDETVERRQQVIDGFGIGAGMADPSVEDVSGWMRDMSADGYAPKSVSKPFRLLKQALKWGMGRTSSPRTPATSASRPSA